MVLIPGTLGRLVTSMMIGLRMNNIISSQNDSEIGHISKKKLVGGIMPPKAPDRLKTLLASPSHIEKNCHYSTSDSLRSTILDNSRHLSYCFWHVIGDEIDNKNEVIQEQQQ